MKKILLFAFAFFLPLITYFLLPSEASAVCPVCTVAVGAGLGLSRYFGIDDSISGIWVGGLIVSLSFWTADWVIRKWPKLKRFDSFRLTILAFVFWSILTFPPLFWTKIIGHPYNTILGIDRLIFGSLIGAVTFLFGIFADKKIRHIKGKQLFSYQKVVFPVVSLVIASILIYYFGGYLY